MSKTVFVALRVTLALSLLGALFIQTVMIPFAFADMSEPAEVREMRIGVLIMVVLMIVMTQIVGVCVWQLVTLIRGGTIFTDAAVPPLNMIVAAVIAASGLMFGMGAFLVPGETVAPGVVVLCGGAAVVIAGLALLLYVLRNLLEDLIAQKTRTAGAASSAG